jgi:hypothetical protein
VFIVPNCMCNPRSSCLDCPMNTSGNSDPQQIRGRVLYEQTHCAFWPKMYTFAMGPFAGDSNSIAYP